MSLCSKTATIVAMYGVSVRCLVPPVGIFIMTLKGGHGLFHVEEKGKCRVAKATGEPKSPQ